MPVNFLVSLLPDISSQVPERAVQRPPIGTDQKPNKQTKKTRQNTQKRKENLQQECTHPKPRDQKMWGLKLENLGNNPPYSSQTPRGTTALYPCSSVLEWNFDLPLSLPRQNQIALGFPHRLMYREKGADL